jgi:3-deoxy-D-manno-octulosonic-acid transferase
VVREAVARLRENGMPLKCIVVSRYSREVPALLEELGPGCLHLKDLEARQAWDLCIVDKYGILEDAYAVADIAVVGGTFNAVGGHNLWEPAKFGIPVFFGPDCHTQQQSSDELVEAGVGFRVKDGGELAERIASVLKTGARQFIESQQRFEERMNENELEFERLI